MPSKKQLPETLEAVYQHWQGSGMQQSFDLHVDTTQKNCESTNY